MVRQAQKWRRIASQLSLRDNQKACRVSNFARRSDVEWFIMPLMRNGLAVLFILLALALFNQNQGAMTGSLGPRAQNPPTPSPTPAEDTERYVEWMKKRGTPVKDKPHEDVSLRFGDWAFFYHGDRPVGSWTPLSDRVGLDGSGHAVTEAENSDWYAFLGSRGLSAEAALKRIAWLFNAGGRLPTSEPNGNRDRITAPTLTAGNGSFTFQGWWEAYSDPPYSRRITITTTESGTKLVIDR